MFYENQNIVIIPKIETVTLDYVPQHFYGQK